MASQEDLANRLLELARDDLESARALDRAELVSDASVGFHAQQAVEKALKATLAIREIDFPFTHNLTLLMQLCEDAGFELPDRLSDADRLTPYAAALRYGMGDPACGDCFGGRAGLGNAGGGVGGGSANRGRPLNRWPRSPMNV